MVVQICGGDGVERHLGRERQVVEPLLEWNWSIVGVVGWRSSEAPISHPLEYSALFCLGFGGRRITKSGRDSSFAKLLRMHLSLAWMTLLLRRSAQRLAAQLQRLMKDYF